MQRRKILEMSAGVLGGKAIGVDDVDLPDASQGETPDMSSGREFSLTAEGSGDLDMIVPGDKETNRAVLVNLYGKVEGWFEGGLEGRLLGGLGETPIPFSTEMKLSRPEKTAMAHTSEYYCVLEGVITECCGQSFHAHGNFQSVISTGEFNGTHIKGEVHTDTDIGWPMKASIKGVQLPGESPAATHVET